MSIRPIVGFIASERFVDPTIFLLECPSNIADAHDVSSVSSSMFRINCRFLDNTQTASVLCASYSSSSFLMLSCSVAGRVGRAPDLTVGRSEETFSANLSARFVETLILANFSIASLHFQILAELVLHFRMTYTSNIVT